MTNGGEEGINTSKVITDYQRNDFVNYDTWRSSSWYLKQSQSWSQSAWRRTFPRSPPKSSFKELGIDSLDTVELLMNLEDKLDMEIELDQKVETVGDLVAFIESKRA